MTARSDISDALARTLKREGLDTLEGAFAYAGGEELSKPGLEHRRRTRLTLTDETGTEHQLYLKRYESEPLSERLKRLRTHGRLLTPAAAEARNIRRVLAADVRTMQTVVWGEEHRPLGGGRSYIIVTAVPGDALERCGQEFIERCRNAGRTDALEKLTRGLSDMLRRLHGAGLVHRDLYASHVFLNETGGKPELYLIDLARVFAPRRRHFRWRVKDLAQLKYSMPPWWVENCWNDLLSRYLEGAADTADRWSRAIDRKVRAMRSRTQRRNRRSQS
ncbi:MAG: lipopolysaccharide kinase InaA family protein [Planctomycetota bacterium]